MITRTIKLITNTKSLQKSKKISQRKMIDTKKNYFSLRRNFGVDEAFMKNLNSFSKKVRTRKSATDLKKLQTYLNYEADQAEGLYKKINNTANMDQEFNNFLKNFKEENDEYPNILDLSRFFDENDALKKDEKMRQEEIDMLREFKKRQFELEQQKVYEEGIGAKMPEKFELGPYLAEEANAFHQLHYMDNENFFFIIIDRGMTTQVTPLTRINRFRYLVFCGNSKGMCGYGTGKGLDFEIALTNALREAKKNLITIDIGEDNPFPRDIHVKFNRMRIYFNSHFKLEAWGNPLFSSMITLAGLDNVIWWDYDRNWNRYSMIYGFFKLISQNKSLKTISEEEGEKLYKMGVGKMGV